MRYAAVALWLALGLVLPVTPHGFAAAPASDWPTTTPKEQGLDPGKLADGLTTIRDSGMPIHSLVLVSHGKLVLDADFYPYDGATPHDLASVTKSVMTTLIGIAIDQGKLRLDQPVLSLFPDRPIANREGRKERMTVADLARMSSGLACTDANDEQTLREMMASPDWTQFTLDLPMAAEPGTTYAYCSPGMHLLSAILTQATGKTALAFAEHYLFGPLGITENIWPADPRGITHGWSDLHLYPGDAAKLGQLWLDGGVWNGTPLVSRTWVEDTVQVHANMGKDASEDYGYGWWINRQSNVGGEYAAEGRGGQEIRVFPALQAVVVTTGGGIDPGQATDMLAPAIVDATQAIPANPTGEARLQAALTRLTEPPAAKPAPPLPATARAISGTLYAFAPNPLALATLRLVCDRPSEALMEITFADGQPSRRLRIGLDGVYRMSSGRYGLPSAQRGAWLDDSTFALEYDEVANIDRYSLRMHFAGTTITIDGQEQTRGAVFRLSGRASA